MQVRSYPEIVCCSNEGSAVSTIFYLQYFITTVFYLLENLLSVMCAIYGTIRMAWVPSCQSVEERHLLQETRPSGQVSALLWHLLRFISDMGDVSMASDVANRSISSRKEERELENWFVEILTYSGVYLLISNQHKYTNTWSKRVSSDLVPRGTTNPGINSTRSWWSIWLSGSARWTSYNMTHIVMLWL